MRKINRLFLILLIICMTSLNFQGLNVMALNANDIQINVDQDDHLDIVLALGKTDSNVTTLENDLRTALINKGISQDKIKIQAVESNAVSAGNTSEGWEIYDHTNNSGQTIAYYRPYYNEVNGNYSLDSHIVPNISTTTNIDFYGYGSPGYKDFMLMPNLESGKKTLDFTIQEGEFYDALNGAGFLFNTSISSNTNLASRTMSGYLLFFQYPYGGAPTVKVFKFTNIDVNAFHNSLDAPIQSYSGFVEIASYVVGTEKTRKVKLEASVDSLKMWYNDTLVNFSLAGGGNNTTLALPTDFGGYGFGPLVGYLSHGCGQHTHFTFYNVTMSTESSKRFSEVIREPEWRPESKRFVINAEDGAVADFSDSVALGEILTRLGNENVNYIGWGKNEVDGNSFIVKNSNNGLFVDKDVTIGYNAQIQAMANYIYQLYIDGVRNNVEYVLYGVPNSIAIAPVSEQTNTIDSNWPNGKWRIDHDPTYYENSTGTALYDNQYLNNLDVTFIETGKYDVYYQDTLVKTVYVHRKPTAKFNVSVDGSYNVTITDLAYDADAQSTANKGIVSTKWQYKLTSDTVWTNGLPTTLVANQHYVFKQVVTDVNEVESTPYLRYISTSSSIGALPVAEFNVSPARLLTYLGSTVSYVDSSYDPQGGAISEWAWNIIKDNTNVYSGSSAKTNFSDLAAGVYKITLKVKNASGVWSKEVARYVTVIRDTTPVTVVGDLATGTYNTQKTVKLTFADEENGSGFSRRYLVLSSNTTTPQEWGSMGTNYVASYLLTKTGVNYLHYRAYDYAGNVTTGYVGPFTLVDDQKPTVPLISNEPGIDDDTWSKDSIVVTAAGSTDDFTAADKIKYEYSTDGVNYVVGNSVTVSGDGSHTIYFKVTDEAGNFNTTSKVVKIDKTLPDAPLLTTKANAIDYPGSVWTGYSVNGELSGGTDNGGSLFKAYEYRIDGGSWTVGTIFTITQTGQHTVEYRSVDNAGNYSSVSTRLVWIDKENPEVFDLTTESPAIDTITVGFTTTDIKAGLADLAYRVYDGTNWSAWGSSTTATLKGYARNQTVTIKVEARDAVGNITQVTKEVTTLTNTAPTAVADSFTMDEDSAVQELDVLKNDLDADLLTPLTEKLEVIGISALMDPNAGTLVLEGGKITFTPAADYNGETSFTYEVQDSYGSKSIVDVTLKVKAVNDAPIAKNDNLIVNEDATTVLAVLGNDVDIDSSVTIIKFTNPSHGKVVLINGKLEYKPTTNYNGMDELTYTINDGEYSSTATIKLTVKAGNDAPVLMDDSATTNYKTSVLIDVVLNDTDIDADLLTVVKTSLPAHGQVTIENNQVKYTPADLFAGDDSFVVTISDGTTEKTSMVKITVLTPEKNNDDTVPFKPEVENPEPTSPEVVKDPKKGEIIIVNDVIYYKPKPGVEGLDSYVIKITENGKTKEYQVLTNIVGGKAVVLGFGTALNSEAFNVSNNSKLKIDLTKYVTGEFTDPKVSINPQFGAIKVEGTQLIYTPTKDYVGPDGVIITVLINGEAVPFTANINVTEAAGFGWLSWQCLLGWLLAAILLSINYFRHRIYFKEQIMKTISYLLVNILVIFIICFFNHQLGYILSFSLMFGWVAVVFLTTHRLTKQLSDQ